MIRAAAASWLAAGLAVLSLDAAARSPLFLGVTTSTENSGLLAHLLGAFQTRHDIQVRAVTAGSGAVLKLAARGDVDVILVHAPEDEVVFIAEGHGIDRRPVMQNRFVIVGLESDPAGVREETAVADAMAAIAGSGALFLSRGDESGTHRAEQRLWQAAGIEIGAAASAAWYRESGSGQGATLNIAANLSAYVLTDEATWATFRNKGGLTTLFESDETPMQNVYSVIRVDPEQYAGINADSARQFADWLTSEEGRATIASFKVDGRQLFRAKTSPAS